MHASDKKEKIHVLMCGSDFSNGGGVVSVCKNYIGSNVWENTEIQYIVTHTNGRALKKIFCFLKGYAKIITKIIRQKVDIVHLHVCDGGPFFRKSIILFTAKMFRVKTILHHHTSYVDFFAGLKGLKKAIVQTALKKADVNIVLGESLKQELIAYVSGIHIAVVHNGVQPQNTNRYNPDGKYLMFSGWFIRRKGFFDFLDAVRGISPDIFGDYKIVLCGRGDEMTMTRVRDMEMDDRIAYIGYADDVKKKELMSQTIVNVLPSYREGMPMTILETMAYGIPSISTDITTMSEVIENGVDGFLIKSGDVAELRNKINILLKDVGLRKRMSECAYQKVFDQFSIKKQVRDTEKIYKYLMK